jgi:beta-galactosidase
MVAEGIMNGKVVCKEEKMPSRRSTKLRLYVDEMGKKLAADGSDFVVVVCEVTDDLGHVRRMAKENIRFTVEGEGEIIGDASINANPRAVEWGSAPVLIRSTKKAGKIKVKAEVQFPGVHAPTPAELEIESIPYDVPMCFKASEVNQTKISRRTSTSNSTQLSDKEKAKMLQEVEAQQADFGVKR